MERSMEREQMARSKAKRLDSVTQQAPVDSSDDEAVAAADLAAALAGRARSSSVVRDDLIVSSTTHAQSVPAPEALAPRRRAPPKSKTAGAATPKQAPMKAAAPLSKTIEKASAASPPTPSKKDRKPRRSKSCHLCEREVASLDAPAPPLGCRECALVFCGSCLEQVHGLEPDALAPQPTDADADADADAGDSAAAFVAAQQRNGRSKWRCLVCEGRCPCVATCAVRVACLDRVRGDLPPALMVSTNEPHGLLTGEPVELSGCTLDEGDGTGGPAPPSLPALMTELERKQLDAINAQHASLTVETSTRFYVEWPEALGKLHRPVKCTGTVRGALPASELHARRGWVGQGADNAAHVRPSGTYLQRDGQAVFIPRDAHKGVPFTGPPTVGRLTGGRLPAATTDVVASRRHARLELKLAEASREEPMQLEERSVDDD